MKENQSLNKLSSPIFIKMEVILAESNPNFLLVHGDTTSSRVCAWARFNRGVKVGHIGAGLRTFYKKSPFLE
jgi:UDP-N-acetylglucosamine 2-epimerase (non-hydrolysing)